MPFPPSIPSPASIFPSFLTPTLPFRRRSSTSTTTSTSASSSSPPTSPVDLPDEAPSYLSGSTSYLRCARCLSDLCPTSQIISKGFTGRHGRAYLVAPPSPSHSFRPRSSRDAGLLPNTFADKAVPRQLVTGAHTVADISCAQCGIRLGWKYVAAEEETQRYKVGKFILETKMVCRSVIWENEAEQADVPPGGEGEDVEFDSQDEDECEDLFSGNWSPQVAKKRRAGKAFLSKMDGSNIF